MADDFSITEEKINEFILFHLTYTIACSLIHALKGFLPVPLAKWLLYATKRILSSSPSLIFSSVIENLFICFYLVSFVGLEPTLHGLS